MLKVYAMALGDYQTNCYIIYDEASSNCCIIGVVKLNVKVTGLNYVLTGSNRISEPCESGTN